LGIQGGLLSEFCRPTKDEDRCYVGRRLSPPMWVECKTQPLAGAKYLAFARGGIRNNPKTEGQSPARICADRQPTCLQRMKLREAFRSRPVSIPAGQERPYRRPFLR